MGRQRRGSRRLWLEARGEMLDDRNGELVGRRADGQFSIRAKGPVDFLAQAVGLGTRSSNTPIGPTARQITIHPLWFCPHPSPLQINLDNDFGRIFEICEYISSDVHCSGTSCSLAYEVNRSGLQPLSRECIMHPPGLQPGLDNRPGFQP